MNTSELLRKLADIIDRMQNEVGADQQADPNQPAANLVPVEVVHVDTADPTTMVSPLQQKFELYKQGADMEVAPAQPTVMMQPNVDAQPQEVGAGSDCGTEAPAEEQTDESGDDEMDVMRRNAGLPATGALMVAREDQ